MASFIACYDLNDKNNPHQEFMEAAKKNGWEPWIKSTEKKWYRLPNTTIVGVFDNQAAAVASFNKIKVDAEVTLKHPITVEKWFVGQYTTSNFNSDSVVQGS